jgi:hypothetical protein
MLIELLTSKPTLACCTTLLSVVGGAAPSAASIGPNSLLSRARRNAATAAAQSYKPDVNYSTYDNNFESKSGEDCGGNMSGAANSSRAAGVEGFGVGTRGKKASRLPWDNSKVRFVLSDNLSGR